jgi:hypothetical protein
MLDDEISSWRGILARPATAAGRLIQKFAVRHV